MGDIGRNFLDNVGLVLGIVILAILFLLIGRPMWIGRRGGGKSPKWQNPGQPQRDEPQKPRKRLGWGRGSRGGERRKREKDGGGGKR